MNFKDLEDLEHGTILVGDDGTERYFHGFVRDKTRSITESVKNPYYIWTWEERQIKNWKIKKPEPNKIGKLAYMIDPDDGDVRVVLKNSAQYKALKSHDWTELTKNEKDEVFEV